jgi:DNA-binding IclR family transcriptional regulator
MDEIDTEARNPVRSIRKAFDITERIRERNGATISELADDLDMPKSSVHSYVSTLYADDYIVKDGRQYQVGLRFLAIGDYARHRRDVYEVARPKADELAEETGERVYIVVEERGFGVYIYQAAGQNAVGLDAHIGRRLRMHCTGVGKALLAHLPAERVDRIVDFHGLPEESENTITDRDELKAELEVVRERGFAFDEGERHEALRCVAAPILDRNQQHPHAAISVAGPTSRLRGEQFREELPEIVRSTASEIELNLAYG